MSGDKPHPRDTIAAVAAEIGADTTSRAVADALDARDELREFRSKFHIPPRDPDAEDPSASGDAVYLCGNSLGLQPRTTEALVLEDLREWQKRGVEGHFRARRPWVSAERQVEQQMKHILGAAHDHEVVVMNSLTVNVHLMMVSFFRPRGARNKILIEAKSFPSDYFAVRSQLAFHGLDPDEHLIELRPRDGELLHRTEDILSLLEERGDEIALVWLGCVQYYTGQAFDMEAITAKAHAKGCVAGFDLAHGCGNLELRLHDWGVDVATFCSYKYLNSGPGSIAGVFVHDRHADAARGDGAAARGDGAPFPRLEGWWGQNRETRFDMAHEFDPLRGAPGWQLSNPAVLPVTALLASADIFAEATMPRLRAKSVLLTGYLEHLIDTRLEGKVEILTPRDIDRRGCQLSLKFTGLTLDAAADALAARGVICDKRRPDVIRAAPTPLYNTFSDVHTFVDIIASVVA